ncbi:pitrilysin family protein [Thermatribacter velox]|jgi:predicted Zn-dependent peptidase|uniref:Pitrilysin family protein n=1 Tax=Thermatribacter velox TaxID=3039681 RepID=A0ABZ2YE26_9BACT
MKEIVKRVQEKQLKNGLKLILLPVARSFTFTVNVSLSLGNLYEEPAKLGISSLLQESILKGTQHRNASEFAKTLESFGASARSSANYFTGKLIFEGPAQNWQAILELFFEAITKPAFLEEEVEKEKNYALSVLASLDDDPLKAAFMRFKKAFFGEHPYAFSSLGKIDTLQNLSRDEILNWYQRVYVPNNMVVAIAGNFEPQKLLEAFELQTENLPPLPAPEIQGGNLENFRPGSQKIIERKKIKDSWLVLGYPAPSITDFKGKVAFDIVNNLLGGSMYSRLFLKVRETEGWSYEVGSIFLPLVGPSFICAYCGFPAVYFDKAVATLRKEFQEVTNLKREEFEETKNYTRGTLLQSLETPSGLAALFSFYEKIGLGWDFVFRYEELLRKIKLNEVKDIYASYIGSKEAIGAVIPESQQ